LSPHPGHEDLHKILQGRRQRAGGKAALVVRAQKAAPVLRSHFGRQQSDLFARFGRRQVPPAPALGLEPVVKLPQDFVLETPAFAGVEFKFLAFLGAQAHVHEKAERTLRKFLQAADR